MALPKILLHIDKEEVNYLSFLKPLLAGKASIHVNTVAPTAIFEMAMIAKKMGAIQVASTSAKLLQLLLRQIGAKLPSTSDYAGSIFTRYDVEFLILDPLDSLLTRTWGKHWYERCFKKFLTPSDWLPLPDFQWRMFSPSEASDLQEVFSSANCIAVDIETGPEDDRIITCISFTGIFFEAETRSYRTFTIVVPFIDEFNIAFAATICRLSAPKIFQGGQYDNAYLLRYGIATINWSFDTLNLFHSWYSELPKDLGFLTAYLVRKWEYHKDEGSGATTELEYFEYNAKDSFTTAICFLAALREIPPWALENYLLEFPLVFPCLLAEMTGILWDAEKAKELRKRLEVKVELTLASLQTMVSNKAYNPGSWQQTQKLFVALGAGDVKGTGKIPRDKVAARHPLNKRILGDIDEYKKDAKLVSTYLVDEKIWNGRVYYRLHPGGTDTSRLASSESAFWCGLQIQNIPKDRKDKVNIKDCFIADDGFLFGEGDYKQNETWGTAYLSGDKKLLEAVHDSSKDFHGLNASAFFGVEYARIVASSFVDGFQEWVHDTLDKELRDLSKRTNHGSNYNMGAGVLLDTMGIANVIRAKQLLGLPASYSLLQVCQYLLNQFAATYATLKGPWYDKCKDDVTGSRFLVSPNGWRRYCFGNPKSNKRDLNAYVAHLPQCLAAQSLNKAFRRVFYEVWLPNQQDFRLLAQIHDSILFMYRRGREDLAYSVARCMDNSIAVRDTFGATRQLRVPVDLKGGATRWSEVKTLRVPKGWLPASLPTVSPPKAA